MHIPTHEFVAAFEKEHGVNWEGIGREVEVMLREVFVAAATVHPEMQHPRARAIYGVDVMLDHCFQPKLLEVTYCPDCTRASTYDMEAVTGPSKGSLLRAGDFWNQVFGCLFLDETSCFSRL